MTFKLTKETTLQEIITMTDAQLAEAIVNASNLDLLEWYSAAGYELAEGYTFGQWFAESFEEALKNELLKRLG
jgi:hypothetical protein